MREKALLIIPVFNEERNIALVLESLREASITADVLVINDGSTDRTSEVALAYGVYVVNHVFNMGIGASFQTGCQFAVAKGYEYIVRIDGDGQHDPAFIDAVLEPVRQDMVDITVGSRFLGNSEFKSSFMRLVGIRLISGVLRLLVGKKVTDPTSGFCAMNRKAFGFFAEHCVDDYPEPEILIHHRNFRITEIPITLMRRGYGYSSITPIKSIYYMYKVLFSIFVSIFRKG